MTERSPLVPVGGSHEVGAKSTIAGRSGRARTCDPRFWRPVLYQLSYTPAGNRALPPIHAGSSTAPARIARAKRQGPFSVWAFRARLRVVAEGLACRPDSNRKREEP